MTPGPIFLMLLVPLITTRKKNSFSRRHHTKGGFALKCRPGLFGLDWIRQADRGQRVCPHGELSAIESRNTFTAAQLISDGWTPRAPLLFWHNQRWFVWPHNTIKFKYKYKELLIASTENTFIIQQMRRFPTVLCNKLYKTIIEERHDAFGFSDRQWKHKRGRFTL